MKAKNGGIEHIEKIKRFREEHLRCKRCGSLNTLHSMKLGIMRCRQCGFEWTAPREEEI